MTESLEGQRQSVRTSDHPEFPLEALPAKTELIIVAGGAAVFILLFAFIIVNYLIDNRIKMLLRLSAG